MLVRISVKRLAPCAVDVAAERRREHVVHCATLDEDGAAASLRSHVLLKERPVSEEHATGLAANVQPATSAGCGTIGDGRVDEVHERSVLDEQAGTLRGRVGRQ